MSPWMVAAGLEHVKAGSPPAEAELLKVESTQTVAAFVARPSAAWDTMGPLLPLRASNFAAGGESQAEEWGVRAHQLIHKNETRGKKKPVLVFLYTFFNH
jgi:hypothetical protein